MRVFKRTFMYQGRSKDTVRWYVRFRDHRDIVRTLPAYSDKALSESLGRKIERLKNANQNLTPELTRWVDDLPLRLKKALVSFGLLNRSSLESSKPLDKQLEDFEQSLLAKGVTPKHCEQTIKTLQTIFDDCGFVFWSDVAKNKVERYLNKLTISQRTHNFYLKAAKQFCKWMVDEGRATASPLKSLKPLTITVRKVNRRSLEPEEFCMLLESTEEAEDRFGMTGHDRAVLYTLAVETGYRAGELRSLKVGDFDFKNGIVKVWQTNTKNKKLAIATLEPETAAELKAMLSNKLPNVHAFNIPPKTSLMIKADLEEAGIDYKDDEGRVHDFHALRHDTGTFLAAAGITPKDAQQIMRHSDINLTMNIYTHANIRKQAAATTKMSKFYRSKKQKKSDAG